MAAPPSCPSAPPADDVDAPAHWRCATALLDLEDPRLRLRAQSLTQLCHSDHEKALAVYGFVKRLPFAKPLRLRLHTAREVLDAGRGDAVDKACLLVALLRICGLAARLRFVDLHGEILRGLTTAISSAARPVLEIWLDGRWAATDTFIFDAPYVAAARARLAREGWEWGYGMHRNGHMLWDGRSDAFLTGGPEQAAAVSLGVLGHFHDPQQLLQSAACQARYPRIARAMRWGMVSPGMNKAVRALRNT